MPSALRINANQCKSPRIIVNHSESIMNHSQSMGILWIITCANLVHHCKFPWIIMNHQESQQIIQSSMNQCNSMWIYANLMICHGSPWIATNYCESSWITVYPVHINANLCTCHKSSQIIMNHVDDTSYLFNALQPNYSNDDTAIVFTVFF